MSAIEGCIFDLDGVIVDTARYHYLAWKRLAKELGHDLTEDENEQLKGVSRMKSLERVLALAGVSAEDTEKERLAERKNVWFNEYLSLMKPTEIFPGVKALIAEMRAAGMKVGLASSSKNARTVIRLLDIGGLFDAIVDGSMITHTKPDPEIFLKTADAMGADPRRCVVIEDAEAGVEAAHAAGMKCVGIGSPALLGKAELVCSQTSQLTLQMLADLAAIRKLHR